MKTVFSFFLVSFLFFNQLSAQTPEKVLFIGNSLTYFNDMPNTFRDISNSLGKNVSVTMHAPGGTGFMNHVNDPNLYDIIRNDTFDIVVMQPGTSESGGASNPVTVTAQYGLIIVDSIRINSPCARIFLYEISNGVVSQNDYPTYFATQTRIKDSITKLGDLMHLPMIPAGECFRNHYTASPDLLLHNSYGDVHPNPNGSYLVACAAYVAIYQDSVNPTVQYAGIPDTTAEYLQDIADNVVLFNTPAWRIGVFDPVADFTATDSNNHIFFTNNSENYDSLVWDFGDGQTSTEENPEHIYVSDGIYTVTLTVFSHGCEYLVQQEVVVLGWGINEHEIQVKLYPNPATNELNFFFDTPVESIFLYDLQGKVLAVYSMTDTAIAINVRDLVPGIYMAEVKSENFSGVVRFEKR